MSERLGFYKKVMLELNHAVLQKRIDEHELHQLFWECTLRCNLNCRHCGSDCRMLSEKDDMPLPISPRCWMRSANIRTRAR